MSGAPRAGAQPEDLYLGNQDNGTFGSTNAGAPSVTWNSQTCCDGFDSAGDGDAWVDFGLLLRTSSDDSSQQRTGPDHGIAATNWNLSPRQHAGVRAPRGLLTFAANQYVVATTTGVFVTLNIGASPIVWTQLGAATFTGRRLWRPGRRCQEVPRLSS